MDVILAATDFSKPANNAVEYAAQLARFFSAKLILVNAFKLPLEGYNSLSLLNLISELRRDAEKKLQDIRDQLISGSYDFGIEVHAGIGSVLDVMREASNEFSADLIVMGITGEGGTLKEIVMGSNTLSVARELSLPLAIISDKVTYRPIKNICLATETDHLEDNTLLYTARDVAQMFNAQLEFVTVEKPGQVAVVQTPENYSFLEGRLHDTKHKQVRLRENNVSTALEYYFKFHETDLVLVNPLKHNFFQKLFATSITEHLAFHIRVPLWVIH